jgi:DNA-binding MarR family transcriptional regulator
MNHVEQIDWRKMSEQVHELYYFSRQVFQQREKMTLTPSEMELLSLVCFAAEPLTPLSLSQRMGMKKESVSRILKGLSEKELLKKRSFPGDERSYQIFLTDLGQEVLNRNYQTMLRPFYFLKEQMGESYSALVNLTIEASRLLSAYPKEED